MTTVLIFEHRGVATAMPAEQAVSATPQSDTALELVQLWEGSSRDERCALLVRSGIGPVAIACSSPRMLRVPHAELRPLTPLLRESLDDMPYIVGAAWVEQSPVWLLDMSRFLGSATARIGNLTARPHDDGH
jgi:hypothetical protein